MQPATPIPFLDASVGCIWLLPGPRHIGTIVLDFPTLAYGFGAVLIGFQLLAFAVFTKIFAISEGPLPKDPRLNRMLEYIPRETGMLAGGLCVLLGVCGSVLAVFTWSRAGFGAITSDNLLRLVVLSVFALICPPADHLQQLLSKYPGAAPALT